MDLCIPLTQNTFCKKKKSWICVLTWYACCFAFFPNRPLICRFLSGLVRLGRGCRDRAPTPVGQRNRVQSEPAMKPTFVFSPCDAFPRPKPSENASPRPGFHPRLQRRGTILSRLDSGRGTGSAVARFQRCRRRTVTLATLRRLSFIREFLVVSFVP
jgi:hypothetical protein